MMIFVYLLMISAALSLYRFFVGPTTQDRLVAFSCITIMSMVAVVILGVLNGRSFYIDIAISFILIDFVGLIVFTKYLGREELK